MPLATALRSFATKPDEARIGALVAASVRFGSPLARLLVLQADSLRTSERHRAEALADRVGVLSRGQLLAVAPPATLGGRAEASAKAG